MPIRSLAAIVGTMLLLTALPPLTDERLSAVGAAWADDDDGGGGDDDDDNGGFGDRGDDDPPPRVAPRRMDPAPAQAPRPSPSPAPLRNFAPNEIVAFNLSDEDLAVLIAQGYEVIAEAALPAVGATSRRLRIPSGTALEAAREEVRALASGQDADFNHYYRSEQACEGPHCPARELIGWPDRSVPNSCEVPVSIGVIDTGINDQHEALSESRLEVHRLSEEAEDTSRVIHGTAVVALLVGDPDSRSPGLVPAARIVAVDAFYRDGRDERADVFTLIQAMDFLADQQVRVLNMSLAGPPNGVLEAAVSNLHDRGLVMVAAAGNGGPRADPVYPAAYNDVIAVTAVDAQGGIYRRAGQGAHIDIAAPGVDVWTAASISGARPKTGTSFAAPFVAAAASLMLSVEPTLSPDDVAERLRSSARDLGDEGIDPIFGSGLLQMGGLCGPLVGQVRATSEDALQ